MGGSRMPQVKGCWLKRKISTQLGNRRLNGKRRREHAVTRRPKNISRRQAITNIRKRLKGGEMRNGISISQRTKPIWGDIRTMLGIESDLSTSSPTEAPSTPSLQAFSTSEPSSPSDCVAPASPTFPASKGSPVRPYAPPTFEEAFLVRQSFKTKGNDLKLWLKNQKGKVTGDWLVRVQCLRAAS